MIQISTNGWGVIAVATAAEDRIGWPQTMQGEHRVETSPRREVFQRRQ
jgi:hypothetical protein